MAEQEKQTNEDGEERKLKDPRDLTKRPPSRAAKSGPEHTRLEGHGVRTTARHDRQVDDNDGVFTSEVQLENFKENQAEDYERLEGRNTGAGPNPYRLPTSRKVAGEKEIKDLLKARDENELDNALMEERALAAHAAAVGVSDAADAEVQTVGDTVSDTGQKIRLKPERVAADERAVLERKDFTHAKAIKDLHEEDPHADYRKAVAAAEAQAEAPEGALTADRSTDPLYGGNVHDQGYPKGEK